MGRKKLAPPDIQSLQCFKDPSEVVAIETVQITEVQLKTWLSMLYFARNDFSSTTHWIRLEELKSLSGYAQHDNKYWVEAMSKFCKTGVKFNVLGKSKQDHGGVVTTLLAGANFQKRPGWIEFQFSEMLKEIVINSKMFSNLSLALIRNIETKSGLALYRIVNDYKGIHSTPTIPIETLRELLGVDKDEYSTFKAFNQWVLKPACKQVKEKTDLEAIPCFIRTMRKVSAVKFEIKEQVSPLLVKKPSSQKNPYSNLGDIELLSEMEHITRGGELTEEDVKRHGIIKELLKERRLDA